MTVLHTGSTKKYSTGWDAIFSGGGKKRAGTATKAKKATAAKKAKPSKPAKKRAK